MRRQNPKTNINDFYPRPALTILLCSLFFISIVGKGQTEDMPLNCGHFLQFNRVTKQVAFILVKDWSTVNPTDTSKSRLIDVDYIKSVDTAKGIKCCILMFKDGTWANGDTIHIKKIIGPSNLPQEYERLKKLLKTGAPLDNLAYHPQSKKQ